MWSQYPLLGELVGNGSETHIQLDKHMEYGDAHRCFFQIDDIAGLIFVGPIPPVASASSSHRQTQLNPRLPTTVRILDYLIALGFCAPGDNRADEFASDAVVDVLADADDFAACVLDLLKDHGRVDEVAREAAQVPDNDHVSKT